MSGKLGSDFDIDKVSQRDEVRAAGGVQLALAACRTHGARPQLLVWALRALANACEGAPKAQRLLLANGGLEVVAKAMRDHKARGGAARAL